MYVIPYIYTLTCLAACMLLYISNPIYNSVTITILIYTVVNTFTHRKYYILFIKILIHIIPTLL